MNVNDERPLWEILGLAIPLGTPWLEPLGPDMEGSALHQTLLAAYDKLFA